ncbi:MAG: flavodoxin family protein [Lachnospiraceae bacterium]|nr:flavodoxin family protein [Lachnospiraceae bacterium]
MDAKSASEANTGNTEQDVIRLKTQVLYVSGTGNTERIAEAIYREIPGASKDILKLDSCFEKYSADTYFVGFWANCGSASVEILEFLSDLHKKNIALFCTCGMGWNTEYYKKIEKNVSAFIPDDNRYLGAFFCQGKMPIRVRRKYEQMETPENHERVELLLRNFDKALLHPDRNDLDHARAFVRAVYDQMNAER